MTEFDSKEKAGLIVEVAIPNGEASYAQKEMERQETIWKMQEQDRKKSVERRHGRTSSSSSSGVSSSTSS